MGRRPVCRVTPNELDTATAEGIAGGSPYLTRQDFGAFVGSDFAFVGEVLVDLIFVFFAIPLDPIRVIFCLQKRFQFKKWFLSSFRQIGSYAVGDRRRNSDLVSLVLQPRFLCGIRQETDFDETCCCGCWMVAGFQHIELLRLDSAIAITCCLDNGCLNLDGKLLAQLGGIRSVKRLGALDCRIVESVQVN